MQSGVIHMEIHTVLDDLRLTSLIEDESLRKTCELSIDLAETGNHREAVIAAAFAMWTCKGRVRDATENDCEIIAQFR